MAVEQLTLNVRLRDCAQFENFFVASLNATTLKFFENFLKNDQTTYGYIWGKPSSGRTHVLQACVNQAEQENLTAIYLPLQSNLTPSALENLENFDLVCIDDIDIIATHKIWEEALFHFFNRSQAAKKHLLLSASCAPRELAIDLPDLKSRLTSGVIFQLIELNENEKLQALQLRAKNRGLQLSVEVGEFLMRRWGRDMSALFNALDKLDHASLAERRKLTVPFVKQVLEI